MKTTIEQLETSIAEDRQVIAEYEKEIARVEEDDDYDHPYWQSLTDELGWAEEALAHRLDQLAKLNG